MNFDAQKFFANSVVALPPSRLGRFFDLVGERDDVIALSIGEPDFPTPSIGKQAACLALEKDLTAYGPSKGLPGLRKAVVNYLERKFDLSYDPEKEIVITVGGSEGILLAIWSILNPGEEILLPEPCFVSYAPAINFIGGIVKPVPSTIENKFKITIADLEARITPKTKALLLNYPCNPTGASLDRNELEAIAAFAKKHDIMVICDEIYAELTYGSKHVSLASLPDMKDRTILISGSSKVHAMTGWRLGYLCCNAQLMVEILKLHQYLLMCAPTIAQHAAIPCFEEGEDDVAKMFAEYDRRREYITKRLRAMGLDIVDPEGAFYAFASIKKTGLSSDDFCVNLLNQQSVAVVPGSAFGESGEGFIRCSYASSMKTIEIACDRMEAFLQTIK